MHEELWAGVDSKVRYAEFFLEQMSSALKPPPPTPQNIVQQASGALITTNWQLAFYAYTDAFLAMARSVPEIVTACFGHDHAVAAKSWFDALSNDEKRRRKAFSEQCKIAYKRFIGRPLSTARNVSLHRTGNSGAQVTFPGDFGKEYGASSPVTRVPDAASVHGLVMPVLPPWQDFTINGKPLFSECQTHLDQCKGFVTNARAIATQVHGGADLTEPNY